MSYKQIDKHCMCEFCKDGIVHDSDCSVHNQPSDKVGECDCEPSIIHFSQELNEEWAYCFGDGWLNNKPINRVCTSIIKNIHFIYDQAKAEQREEDARIAEGMKRTENKHYGCGDCCSACDDDFYNKTCDDIAKAIRED